MKRTFSKLIYVLLFLAAAGLVSCEGDEGPMGPQGPAGPQGEQGPPGADGADGADGNANVTIISLPNSEVTWTSGSYLGRTSNVFTLTTEEVNQDIIDHGIVLGYFNLFGTAWYSLPFTWENAAGTSRQYLLHTYALNSITLYAYETTGVLSPGVSEYRFMLITGNNVSTKSSEGKGILSEMEKAGVDVNNYYELMDYFGIDY